MAKPYFIKLHITLMRIGDVGNKSEWRKNTALKYAKEKENIRSLLSTHPSRVVQAPEAKSPNESLTQTLYEPRLIRSSIAVKNYEQED